MKAVRKQKPEVQDEAGGEERLDGKSTVVTIHEIKKLFWGRGLFIVIRIDVVT